MLTIENLILFQKNSLRSREPQDFLLKVLQSSTFNKKSWLSNSA
ncbi:hypothetical protein APA_1434 [Pseudanabaena sp. lw0831]|nr:hypothetical protein APA_1434 [Pseudanabaena sp. lw0831]